MIFGTVYKCTHCGALHLANGNDWATRCLAVKKVIPHGYVYGPDGITVSHPTMDVEYLSLDEQLKLLEMNKDVKEPCFTSFHLISASVETA